MAGGKTYEGQWEDSLPNGFIREIDPDGDLYVGQYKAGKRHGQGKLIVKSLKTYEGTFLDNVPHGQGKFTIPGVAVYEGTFTPLGDSDFHVQGQVRHADGRVENGEWQNNVSSQTAV